MEQVIADFSGGLNLTAAIDKLPDKECLLADHCKFSDLGSVQAGGLSAKVNSSAYQDASANKNVHSLWLNPTILHIAGIGNDIFAGLALDSLVSVVAGVNSSKTKMSFCDYQNAVFYDCDGVPRYSSLPSLHLPVDWPPVNASGTITVQKNGTSFSSAGGTGTPWVNPSNAAALDGNYATFTRTTTGGGDALQAKGFGFAIPVASQILGIQVDVERIGSSAILTKYVVDAGTVLLRAGVADGSIKTSFSMWPTTQTHATYGGNGDLWGTTWTAADINNANFGVSFSAHVTNTGGVGSVIGSLDIINITVYYIPLFTATASATAGNLNGTYTYKATLVDANGYEGDSSDPTNSVTPANKQVDLTLIPLGDARTVKRKLYRKGGKLTAYYWVADIADNFTTSYTDNVSDDDVLTNAIILAGEIEGDFANTRIGANVKARYPEEYYDRLFWVLDGTNTLIWSKPLNPFAYPVEFFIPIGDAKECTRSVRFHEDLIIFKTDSIWRLTGKEESDFDLIRLPSSQGCDMPFTIVKLENEILFTNSNGMWSFDGIGVRPVTNRLEPFFNNITRNGISPITKATGTNKTYEAVYANGICYLIYLDQAANQRILIVDKDKTGTIARFLKSSILSIRKDPVLDTVYFGDVNGFINLLNATANDSGVTSTFSFQTKYYDQKRNSRKEYDHIEFDIDTGGIDVTPTVFYNSGNDSETLAPINTTERSHIGRLLTSAAAKTAYNISVKHDAAISSASLELHQLKITFDERKQRSRTANA